MYELYLNGNKVKQINYIGEHDYNIYDIVDSPQFTSDDQHFYSGEDCNAGRLMGEATVDITCGTSGATIYHRYGLCTVDANCNPTYPDLTNEPWVLGDYISIHNTGTNTCDDGSQYWYVEAYATKSGMLDSSVGSDLFSVPMDEYIDCNDCSNYEALGYPSYEDCDCAVNGNCGETDCSDCENWEECGYTSWDDCYITNYGIFPTPTVTGHIDANVSSTMSNINMLAYGVENLEWKVDYGYSIFQNYVTNWTAGSYVSGSGVNSLYNYTRNDPWTDVDGYAHIKVTMRRDGVESETYHYKFNQVRIIDVTE